jgi:hypothetical protein
LGAHDLPLQLKNLKVVKERLIGESGGKNLENGGKISKVVESEVK